MVGCCETGRISGCGASFLTLLFPWKHTRKFSIGRSFCFYEFILPKPIDFSVGPKVPRSGLLCSLRSFEPHRNMQKNATLRIAFFLKYGADEVRIEFARTAVLVSPARCARGLLLRKSFPQKFRDADFCVHFVRSNPIRNMQKNATLRIAFF